MHIGKYFGYIFNGAIRILFYPRAVKKYLKDKDSFPLEERYNVVREKIKDAIDNILKLRVNVIGAENLNDDDTYLFVPNHQSFLDPLALVYFFDKPSIYVSKKEVKKMPVIKKLDYVIDAYFLDRENPRDALKMVKTCQQQLKNKRSVVIFAEGTRSKDKEKNIQEYKAGSFKCAYNTGAKIVPVVIDKSYIPLSLKYKNTDRTINISFLKPIEKEVYEELPTTEVSTMVNNLAKEELKRLRNENK